MKKKILMIALLLGLTIPGWSSAEVVGISEQQWNQASDDYWFNQKCDEVRNQEVYAGQMWIYLDSFVNPAINPWPLYLHKNKVLTRGDYLLYNPSQHPKGNGMTIFNRDLLERLGWKVNPGQTVRHMSTAEEVSGATFAYNWRLNTPYIATDGTSFSVPNYRSNGTHPQKPTMFPSYDAEFRTITLYDSDDNLATNVNNRAIVECQNNVIRWCGDGILDTKYGETCDPADPNRTGRGVNGCSATCQPLNPDPVYDLALTKRVTDKKSHYKKGDTVTFTITVFNQGNQTAKNLEITDYIPAGLEVVDAAWTVAGDKATRTLAGPILAGQSASVTLQMRIKPDFAGTEILNLAEITRDNSGEYGLTDKDSTPDQNKDNDCFLRENLHNINGNGKDKSKCDTTTDEDDHDGDTLQLLDQVYDLALTKVIKAPAKTSYSLGDSLTFLLTVHNQGNLVARNVQITDYLPSGLILNDSRWAFDATSRKATIAVPGEIAVNGSVSVEMTVTIDGAFKGSKILNKAEISQDNASDYGTVDKDSTPDSTHDNDCFSEDFLHRTTGNGKAGSATNCNESTDEDDHDGVPVIISKPTIKKDLQETGKIYQVGDLVGFVMPFANNTNETVNNVSIKDLLPLNLEYVSSEIQGVVAPNHATYRLADGKTTVDVWSGFNLLPGQKGTLYLTGRVLESNYDSRLNTVGIYTNDILVESDAEPYNIGGRKVVIEKSVLQREVKTGNDADYLIKVTVTEGAYDELIVTDTLPAGLVYKPNTYTFTGFTVQPQLVDFTISKNAQGLDVLTWKLRFPNKISANQHFSIALKATLTATERKAYTNVACVIDPKKPNDAPICDPEDIIPPTPTPPTPTTPTMQIKKYVNKKEQEAGREDLLMTGFARGQTGFFTLEVQDATAGFSEFTITDIVEGNLAYIDSTKMLNNAFTGLFLRGNGNAASYKYTTTLNVENLGNERTKLTWKVVMTEGQFLPGDKYRVQFMAKVNGSHTNVSTVDYPGGKDDDDVKVDTEEVKLLIKKYVSASLDKDYNDTSARISPNATAYFKLVVTGATNALTGFRIEDTLKNSDLLYLSDSEKLANNLFTGVITFGANNPTKPAYTITPKVVTTATETKLTWIVKMADGAYFMPGDSLEVVFMTKKINNTTNTAHVYYPKRDGTEGHSEDPAGVTYSSGGGWWGGWGWGWWGWGGTYGPSCGNGRKDGNEICDLGPNGGTIGSNGHLFSNLQGNTGSGYINKEYAGYQCTAACGVKDVIAPKCFNLQNGSISIMKGEVLPFYWNLDGIAGKVSLDKKKEWLTNHYVESSSKADSTPKIDISTMKCEFSVYGPGMKPIYTFTAPCFNPKGWSSINGATYDSIKEYIQQNREGWLGGSQLINNEYSTRNVFDSLDNQGEYPVLFPLSSKMYISNFGQAGAMITADSQKTSLVNRSISEFGEYKIALEKISYEYVSKNEKGVIVKESKTFDDRICEVDFAVTDPYMIQRSPYGIGHKATVALNQYKLMNGTSFMDQFFTTTKTDAKEYAAPANIKSLFNTFKNKYAKLAKPVKWTADLLKVPGKSIYLYKGNTELNELLGKAVTSKPFTLIAMNGQNLTIKGDLNANAMIMTSGKIIFDATNACNGERVAGKHAGQVVKGIFYAGAGFDSSNHGYLRNTEINLNDNQRCNYGNLHIKGVAIGDLSKVVEARRSELYTWFGGHGGGNKAAEKTQKVIYGASVLLDYNPTLRGNLPPGANEFNKALAVYRK